MTLRILVINAHPDPRATRLAFATAEAYQRGAVAAGHDVRRIDLGAITFPPVITGDELSQEPPEIIRQAQEAISWAQHIVIVFPLWLGAPPALLKSYFEQICRYDFAFDHAARPLLKGRSAHLIFTMMLPSFVFALFFRAGVKGFIRGCLWASGIKPARTTRLAQVLTAPKEPWLRKIEALGRAGK